MRINLFGGPGSGKSTTAARVFSELKERKTSVEHVSEYVKSWAYSGRPVKHFDQIYIFGKQQQYEFRWLTNGVKNVITDSPCFLSAYYSRKYISEDMAEAIWRLCELYDQTYPCVNIFLERGDKEYVAEGRYQTEEEARSLDVEIYEYLMEKYEGNVIKIPYTDKQLILDTVLKYCDK